MVKVFLVVFEIGCVVYVYMLMGVCGVGKMIMVWFLVCVFNYVDVEGKSCLFIKLDLLLLNCEMIFVGNYMDVLEMDVVL